ncbi:uncharacterized protein BYT42DRAFT_18851 [Radiomyces spectabilis]|uniref:uncharacterized protein n=1 Tax=Radiomyces spectabilis TaxID=64574 RepID=UPI00221FC59F|nr:uncharacterized protein BYT42DRAFT_18851 [Radiomyces spectabilis]KAI8393790.1 hypothetical protein BYT42DRAFT_18851 [Radiomyces spectabilis]
MTNNLLDVEPVGYWGPITSSVDWCEKNYTHWYYVAEWWNTLSVCIGERLKKKGRGREQSLRSSR